MRGRWELSDAQWKLIEPILRPKRRTDGRGRPWQDTRAVLNGILWVLGTGAQWRELPQKYPPRTKPAIAASSSGCGRASWNASCGYWPRSCMPEENWELEEAFIDASFSGAKKGVLQSGPPGAGKGRKSSLSPMITLFLSPLVSRVLRRTKANSSKEFWDKASSTPSPHD